MEKLRFELTHEQANLVLTALAKLPIEVALETFHVFRTQAESQIAKPNQNANIS